MAFKDHFSRHAGVYRRYRPHYPEALFVALAARAPGTGHAWDVATGNGQAALGLVRVFDRVTATDASADQIAHAERHERIQYRVLPAEKTDFPAETFDAVTVAQAAHWLDLERFYAEAERVLRPRGVLALLAYGLHEISPEIDAEVLAYYHDTVGPYWPPERRHVESRFTTLPFPFEKLELPPFELREEWDLASLAGYLKSWSASERYRADRGVDPVSELLPKLERLWGDPRATRSVRWPLTVLAAHPK